MGQTRYLTFGDKGLIVEFGNQISPEISTMVRSMFLAVKDATITGIYSLNPTYRSLMIEYYPDIIRYEQLIEKLKIIEGNMGSIYLPDPDIFEIPTLYGGEYGPDIKTVMDKNNLTEQEVIKLHTETDYLVYMLGFTPGFSYLGGMDERLNTPRLDTPRTKISGGSVGIAGSQTGFYSIDSPGGWQLIGRTPIRIYDPLREKPILHKAGDYIRFISINKEKYDEVSHQVQQGTYKYRIYPMNGGNS